MTSVTIILFEKTSRQISASNRSFCKRPENGVNSPVTFVTHKLNDVGKEVQKNNNNNAWSQVINNTTKYLGINLAHDLRWNDHVNEVTTKENKTLNFLRLNLLTCLAKSKEWAYKAFVRPIVECSATVWDP